MISIITSKNAQTTLAENLRKRRLAMGLTQAGLSQRSGVALATLRKFEQQGSLSVESLFKLMVVVGGLDALLKASEPEVAEFSTIDEVIASGAKPARKRGRRS